jgi:hypothetical protein
VPEDTTFLSRTVCHSHVAEGSGFSASETLAVHQRERTDIVVKTSSRKRSRADHGFGYFIEETYRGCLLLRLLIGTPQRKLPVLVHAKVTRAIGPGQMAGVRAACWGIAQRALVTKVL